MSSWYQLDSELRGGGGKKVWFGGDKEVDRARTPDPFKVMLRIRKTKFLGEKFISPGDINVIIPGLIECIGSFTAAKIYR